VESVFEVLLRGRFSGSVLRGPLRGVLRGFIDCRDRLFLEPIAQGLWLFL
jgi:hypothetical protein